MCGEKLYRIASASAIKGSPPRVRGEAAGRGDVALCRGITPACAGRRHSARKIYAVQEDHPRVCGEKPSYAS